MKNKLNHTNTEKDFNFIIPLLEKSFPFYFIIDKYLNIIKTGRSIQKFIPVKTNFKKVFTFFRPSLINIEYKFNSILRIVDVLCILKIKHNNDFLKLKGTFRLLDNNKLIFLGSPWITTEEELDFHGLLIDDFDVTDNVIDMIMVNKINGNYIEDVKKLNKSNSESFEIIEDKNALIEKFFDLSLDFICLANTEGYFLKVNKTFTRVLGYDEKTLLKNKFLDFVHPDDLESTLNEVKKLSSGVLTYNFENRYRKSDGSYIILNWNTSPDPSTGMLYAIARDMTLFYKEKNIEIENVKLKSQELISSALIKRVLPETLAERMLKGEKIISDYYPQATIMFIDICRFSILIEEMPASTILLLMKNIFSRIDGILKKYNCEKIKTIGDGYLAISGAPVFSENHAEQIINAAFEILEPFELPQDITEYFPENTELNFRIGIHTGPVVGCVLPGDRMHWDIFSKAVIVASRMEQQSLAGHIHVSADLVKHIKNRIALNQSDLKINFERRGEIEIKNIGKIHTYFINKVI
jgi:PAS domain S-box-containing protein